MVSRMIATTSAAINPSNSIGRRIGVSSRRSKYPPWMSVTSALAREMPVTAKMIATGSWNALKSSTEPDCSAKSCSAPTLTT